MVEEMYQQESKEEAENHNQDQHQDNNNINNNNNNDDEQEDEQQQDKENTKNHNHHMINYHNKINSDHDQPPQPLITAPPFTTTNTTTTHAALTHANRSDNINDTENDPSLLAINTQYCYAENQGSAAATMSYSYSPISNTTGGMATVAPPPYDGDTCRRNSMIGAEYRTTGTGEDATAPADHGSTLIRYGTTSGDVSLTLGLRHAGNLPDKASFFS